MYAIDTEWNIETGEFLCGTVYGGTKDTTFFIERGKETKCPRYIDDVAVYYLSPRDITLLEPYVKFREYFNLATLISIRENYSTYRDKHKGGVGLEAEVKRYLGVKMEFKKMAFGTYVTRLLRQHNIEDTKRTYDLAEFLLRNTPEAEILCTKRMEVLNQPWKKMAEQVIHYDLEWQNGLINPQNLLKTSERLGVDFFKVPEPPHKRAGKLCIDRRKFQDFLKREGLPVTTQTSNASYSDGGILWGMHWKEFEQIGRTAREDRVRDLCNFIHTALRCHTAQTGEARFNSKVIRPLEIVCAQSSGRVSHKACPISAGVLFRMAVIPPPGYKTLVLDIKSQEVVLAALFSGDKALQAACKDDVYSAMYSQINGKPYEKLGKTDPRRIQTKEITLPFLYGVGANTLGRTMACELAYAKSLLFQLDRAYPDFYAFKQNVIACGVECHRLYTGLDQYPLKIVNRKVHINGVDYEDTYNPRQVVNHTIQGTGADMLRHWVKMLDDMGYLPFATLHDGLYIYVPSDFDSNILVKASQDLFNELLPLWEGQSWVVEMAEFRGHLFEKGDDYYKLVALLKNSDVEAVKKDEICYIAGRG